MEQGSHTQSKFDNMILANHGAQDVTPHIHCLADDFEKNAMMRRDLVGLCKVEHLDDLPTLEVVQ